MVYAALLRGINVGGKNKVDMKQLKAAFERLGLQRVQTYINSGNIVFGDDTRAPGELTRLLETAIQEDFGFAVKVLLRDIHAMTAVAEALPDSWVNDNTMKCDVMFLWETADSPKILEQLTIKPGIDDVKYVPGVVLWRVDRQHVTKSGMMKLVGTDTYKQMTIRNCNTVRKLAQLMQDGG